MAALCRSRGRANSGPKANIRYNRAMTQKRHKIAVIAFDGITPFHLSVPSLVFRDAAAFDLRV